MHIQVRNWNGEGGETAKAVRAPLPKIERPCVGRGFWHLEDGLPHRSVAADLRRQATHESAVTHGADYHHRLTRTGRPCLSNVTP